MSMLVIDMDWWVFQDKKRDGMELSTGKILEENLFQSAFHQTLGDEFTFQQDYCLPSCLPRRKWMFLSGRVTILNSIDLKIKTARQEKGLSTTYWLKGGTAYVNMMYLYLMSRFPPKVAPLPVRAVLGGRRRRPTSCHRSIFSFSFAYVCIVYTCGLLVDFGGYIYLRCLLVFVGSVLCGYVIRGACLHQGVSFLTVVVPFGIGFRRFLLRV